MKSLFDCAMHRKEITSSLLVGGEACSSALTFSGSGVTPLSEIRIPHQGISDLPIKHFSSPVGTIGNSPVGDRDKYFEIK